MPNLSRIGVTSDTHGDVSAWEKALELWGPVDLILHAGDVLYHGPRNPLVAEYRPPKLAERINASSVPLLIARGNCDAEVDQMVLEWPLQSPLVLLQTPFLRLIAVHGHGMDKGAMAGLARRYRADVLVCGHTHVPLLEEVDGILLFNPGSPSLPKGKEGPTVGLIEGRTVTLKALSNGETLGRVELPVG
ncbi:phosphodiesterase [Thermanaeromonas sp. C210]|uniref:phosphodiesterase n=1 Tax=Thermanaeromonas sp. C210 TaxID=2731925 RepID=UPI00155C16AC|nr:phosphodiesterase [Thermanaeromonas sp. C210]GFN21855.1 phosphoesterase [Thermanaeromonas sp. C210]